MLRTLLVLLLAANAAMWAWTQGWLEPFMPAPGAAEREPARLTSQVRADAVKLVSPAAAVVAKASDAAAAAAAAAANSAAASRCVEAGPFGLVDATAAEAALEAGGFAAGSWERDMRGPAQIWLRVPRADATLRDKLQALATGNTALAAGFKACASP